MKDFYTTIIEHASIIQCCQMLISDLRKKLEKPLIIYTTTQFAEKWVNTIPVVVNESKGGLSHGYN